MGRAKACRWFENVPILQIMYWISRNSFTINMEIGNRQSPSKSVYISLFSMFETVTVHSFVLVLDMRISLWLLRCWKESSPLIYGLNWSPCLPWLKYVLWDFKVVDSKLVGPVMYPDKNKFYFCVLEGDFYRFSFLIKYIFISSTSSFYTMETNYRSFRNICTPLCPMLSNLRKSKAEFI